MESKKALEDEVYVTPECEVIEFEVENSILITGSTGEASHEHFLEDDYSGRVVWE